MFVFLLTKFKNFIFNIKETSEIHTTNTPKNYTGKMYFYEIGSQKIIESISNKGIAKLRWRTYGNDDCSNLNMKLLDNGDTILQCNCSRVEECQKPYGKWKWSIRKPILKFK